LRRKGKVRVKNPTIVQIKILLPKAFYSTICFYYALLREEDGSGREGQQEMVKHS
jgi:hypothetical protein